MRRRRQDDDTNVECTCWPETYQSVVECVSRLCQSLSTADRREFGHELFLNKIWHPAERRWRLHGVLHPMPTDEKRAYLYVLVRNAWKNKQRHNRTQPWFVGDDLLKYRPADSDTSDPIQAKAILHQEHQRIERALRQLEPYESTVFIMAEIDGCTLEEIATYLGKSRTRIWQIRRAVKVKINALLYPVGSQAPTQY